MIWRFIGRLAAFSASAFILLEVFFRTVVPASSVPFSREIPEYGLGCFESGQTGPYSLGRYGRQRATYRINGQGWNSAIEYFARSEREHGAVAVIGDSYVEAFAVDPDDHISAHLGRLSAGRFAGYSFGQSGTALSGYLALQRYVRDNFRPDIFVLVIVHNDLDESIQSIVDTPHWQIERSEGEWVETPGVWPGVPRWITRTVVKSALARYLMFNANLYAEMQAGELDDAPVLNPGVDVQRAVRQESTIRDAARFMIARAREQAGEAPLVVMMDAPEDSVRGLGDRGASLIWLHGAVGDACEAAGVPFLDLTDALVRDYQRAGIDLYNGHDGHWTAHAHAVIADTLWRFLDDTGALAAAQEGALSRD